MVHRKTILFTKSQVHTHRVCHSYSHVKEILDSKTFVPKQNFWSKNQLISHGPSFSTVRILSSTNIWAAVGRTKLGWSGKILVPEIFAMKNILGLGLTIWATFNKSKSLIFILDNHLISISILLWNHFRYFCILEFYVAWISMCFRSGFDF